MPSDPSPATPTLPTLIRRAQHVYGTAMQAALDAAGYDDLPRTGYRVVGALARGPLGVQELANEISMTKQGVGRLTDLLVARGYVSRRADESDRRRVFLELTEAGRAATAIAHGAIVAVDAHLASRISPQQLAAARATLEAVAAFGREHDDTSEGRRPLSQQ